MGRARRAGELLVYYALHPNSELLLPEALGGPIVALLQFRIRITGLAHAYLTKAQ